MARSCTSAPSSKGGREHTTLARPLARAVETPPPARVPWGLCAGLTSGLMCRHVDGMLLVLKNGITGQVLAAKTGPLPRGNSTGNFVTLLNW